MREWLKNYAKNITMKLKSPSVQNICKLKQKINSSQGTTFEFPYVTKIKYSQFNRKYPKQSRDSCNYDDAFTMNNHKE